MGERYIRIVEVAGSNPARSTFNPLLNMSVRKIDEKFFKINL